MTATLSVQDLPRTAAADALLTRFKAVRKFTEWLCEPLETEDYVVQSMPDASPVKWHLAHTSWFYETFVLEPYVVGHKPVNPEFRVLFNSYYETVGPQFTRSERGMLTRPSVRAVYDYRRRIDEAVLTLASSNHPELASIRARIELGLHHEHQHQELLLTDLQHAFFKNPLLPVYRPRPEPRVTTAVESRFESYPGGLAHIGHAGEDFAYDNEHPRHRVIVEPYKLSTRLVTQGEYLAFIRDKGYARPELWLSEGHAFVQRTQTQAPLYWLDRAGEYSRYSLHGEATLALDAPVSNISFYEADAYARWAGARLPTEAEWELAYGQQPIAGQFVDEGLFSPQQTESGFGSVWTWTASPYIAYPGFRAPAGALGEYNGKFMCDQWVLRGGSCFTPRASMRGTYRNFFPAAARWQVTGIRLASQ